MHGIPSTGFMVWPVRNLRKLAGSRSAALAFPSDMWQVRRVKACAHSDSSTPYGIGHYASTAMQRVTNKLTATGHQQTLAGYQWHYYIMLISSMINFSTSELIDSKVLLLEQTCSEGHIHVQLSQTPWNFVDYYFAFDSPQRVNPSCYQIACSQLEENALIGWK